MPRALLMLAMFLGACASGIDDDVTPESLWIAPDAPVTPVMPDGAKVRAITLNLHGGHDATAPRIVSALEPHRLDVLGLQECPRAYADEIGAALGLPHRVGVEGVVLLSRAALTATRAVSLVNGRSFVSARTIIDGAEIAIYVAHLGWNVEGDKQCRELIDEHVAPDPSKRLLVMGDFNDEHHSSQADILETELEDVFTALGWYPGQRISWPATGFDGSEGSQLIDLFYYRKSFPAFVVQADVLNFAPALSDHKPAFVELIYPRTEEAFVANQPAPIVTIDPAKNLLQDPGAEAGGQGWSSDRGLVARGVRQTQAPRSGDAHFTGADSDPQLPFVAGWSQKVAIGARWLDVAGWMAVGYRTVTDDVIISNVPQPYDEGEVIVDLEDTQGTLLGRWSSGRRDTLKYHPFADRIPVPAGAASATMRLLSHRKEASGSSHDAVFDDLYLALGEGPEHGSKGEIIRMDGALKMGGWSSAIDGQQLGVMVYPAQSRSGPRFLAAGPLVGSTNPAVAIGTTDPVSIEANAVELGGWIRTVNALGSATLSLVIYEGEKEWGTLALPPVEAAEWTYVCGRARIPKGATHVALRAEGDVAADQVLLDELFVRAIEVP